MFTIKRQFRSVSEVYDLQIGAHKIAYSIVLSINFERTEAFFIFYLVFTTTERFNHCEEQMNERSLP